MTTIAIIIPGMTGGLEGLVIVGSLVVLFLAPKMLPRIARNAGRTLAELRHSGKALKEGIEEGEKTIKDVTNEVAEALKDGEGRPE